MFPNMTAVDSELTLVEKLIGLHGRAAWFKMPFNQEIKVKGLKGLVETGMNEYGGIIDLSTSVLQSKEIIKKYSSMRPS